MPPATDDAFLAGLFAGIDSQAFEAPPSSSQLVTSVKPTPLPSSSRRKRLALTPIDANTRLSTPRASQKSQPVSSPVSERQGALDALLAGLSESDFACPSSPIPSLEALPTRLAWKGRDERPPGHVPLRRRFLRGTVDSVMEQRADKLGSTRLVIAPVLALICSRAQLTQVVHVHLQEQDETVVVQLEDDWIQTSVKIGDIIQLVHDSSLPLDAIIRITRASGFVIVHPDTLVSATRIADANKCLRKPLLQEKVRSSSNSTTALVYGNILHELLQRCLVADRWDEHFRASTVDALLVTFAESLWEIEMSFDVARVEVMARSEAFESWARKYVGYEIKDDAKLHDPHGTRHEARASLTAVLDIEEDIVSPRYGMKGKVDATLLSRTTTTGRSDAAIPPTLSPFEIKTGRSNTVMEHRAQTMLYTLLLSDRYDLAVDAGLLLYTQQIDLIRVEAARNELRGLVMLRNELATYLQPGSKVEAVYDLDDGPEAFTSDVSTPDSAAARLPEPIDSERGCARCYAADVCMLYRRTVEGQEALADSVPAPLVELYDNKVGHLTSEHADFFRHWEQLISLEEQESTRYRKEIWTMSGEQRQKVGRCFAGMVVEDEYSAGTAVAGTSTAARNSFHCKLVRADVAGPPLLAGHISIGDAILVSVTSGAYAVAHGFVIDLGPAHVSVSLDHTLRDLNCVPLSTGMTSFRIDKDELIAGLGRLRDNLANLFYANGDEHRRRLIVELTAPRIGTVPDDIELVGCERLNETQRGAIARALAAEDYALILGMPGTGKTTTIAALVRNLVARGKTVLLTSYTHSAVDSILAKLSDLGEVTLRLGNVDKIMPELRGLAKLAGPPKSIEDVDDRFMRPRIVATTALTAVSHILFLRRTFDVCIVDEASQIMLPVCLGPIRHGKSFILVGDHNQLPPLVRSTQARLGGLDISLFRRLCEAHPEAIVSLNRQYRMSEDIMAVANKLVYDGQLVCGSERVALQTLLLPRYEDLLQRSASCACPASRCWIASVVDPSRGVVFIDTDAVPACEDRLDRLVHNMAEADVVAKLVTALSEAGLSDDKMAVITPYRQQIKTIVQRLPKGRSGVEVLTADRSQGRDKDCIIISFVRSNADRKVGELLHDWRRLNVCFTRAKRKLIMIGSRSTLEVSPALAPFFQLADERNWIVSLATHPLDCLR